MYIINVLLQVIKYILNTPLHLTMNVVMNIHPLNEFSVCNAVEMVV